MPSSKKVKEKKVENCSKEVSENYKGCLANVCETKGWDIVEIKGSEEGKNPDEAAGIIMGEPRFIEFIGKAIVARQAHTEVVKMMQEAFVKAGGKKPTTH